MTRSGRAGIVVRGAQRPRIEFVAEGDDHPDADAVIEFAAAAGVVLDPWQERCLRLSLRRRDGGWAAFAVGLCVPRQNGKNGITEVRELAGPLVLGENLVIHTAHLADTSKEAFRRIELLIDANDWLGREVRHIWRTNGHEAIEFRNGARIRFRTRTKGGGRGFSGDLVVFDEAMEFPERSLGAILPVVSARPDPQVWYAGSAVDQQVHENGVVFARVRDRAVRGEDKRLTFFEWSVDAVDPDSVDDEVAADPESWAVANPALGIRIDPEYVASERSELAARTFAVERLGVGDWPDLERQAVSVIDPRVWLSLEEPESEPGEVLVYAFDVAPDRARSSLCVASKRPDGVFHVEVVDRRPGTEWLVDRLQALAGAGVSFVCDGAPAPASSLLPELAAVGVQVTTLRSSEMAQACGFMFDTINQRALRHVGDRELVAAVRGAATRPLGDGWAWSRRNSTVDISPLVACTLALWCASRPAGDVWMQVW